ncbi:MurT ligase domain-containing protein [Clostridium sp. JNZ J1-5]|nr:Mur ligase family protein [Clostridium sp.]
MHISNIIYRGGTNFPGKIALKFDEKILTRLSKNYEVILITGTNGKTTTTNMIYSIIKNSGVDVITNSTGANLYTGIISCFLKNYSVFYKNRHRYAVIEVDEANVKYITEYISPKIICITNLFRDQLDRYGEVYTTLEKIIEGIKKTPASILILNGDESLFGNMSIPNKILYYGFNSPMDKSNKIPVNADAKFCKICKTPYNYNFVIYNHLGDFYCPSCGYKRPRLDFSIDKVLSLTPSGSNVEINNNEYFINQAGTYNVYNALCAFATCKTLNIDESVIHNSLKSLDSSFGRQEIIKINRTNLKIILVKNPAGFDEALNSINLDQSNKSLALLLNDNYADGKDVSWIWDVDFENLNNHKIDNILLSGVRLYDLSIRLKVAGFNEKLFLLCDNYESLLDRIENSDDSMIYMLATYTAMTSFRKFLNNKGYIKKLW